MYANLQISNKLCEGENISKTYGDQLLFRDVSFNIKRGDRLVIVGPNGYGKTTFIKILAGSASSDSGRIKWQRGQDVYVEGAIDDFIYYNQVLDKLDLNDTVSHALNFIGIAHRAPGKKVNRFPVQA
ncbi:MAG: ABC-F family ATP-binding cassette domain-containing protein [Spirochaetes bacterium]|nr:ABC-F family ATP-binding cassette domain-containing protein [Spirochaetota bacterium]